MPQKELLTDDWEVGPNPTVDPAAKVIATAPEETDRKAVGRERFLRRAFTAVLALVVGAGALNAFGARSATAVRETDGVRVEVVHPVVTRPGLAIKFEVVVEATDGEPLPPEVDIAVDAEWLESIDENGLDPVPKSGYADQTQVVWTFEVAPGRSTLVMSLDARIEPGVQWGRAGEVSVTVGDVVVDVPFRTTVLP